MSTFLKQLYSGAYGDPRQSASDSLRQRLQTYSEERGWKMYTGSKPDDLRYYRQIMGRQDQPLRRLVGTVQRPSGFHIVAPTELMAGKYAEILFGSSARNVPLSDPRLQKFVSVIQGHEVAEAAERAAGVTGKFGSHASENVIRAEMEMGRRMGQQTAEDVVTFRRWEQAELKKRGFTSPHWKQYSSRMETMLGEFEGSLQKNIGKSASIGASTGKRYIKGKWKIAAGGAAAIVGGALLFSGKEPDYYEMPEDIGKEIPNFVGGTGTHNAYKGMMRQIVLNNRLTRRKDQDTLTAMRRFLNKLPDDEGSKQFVVVNPIGVRAAAKRGGLSYSEQLGDTVKHESFHVSVSEKGVKGSLKKLNSLTPGPFAAFHDRVYGRASRTRNINASTVFEEYLAHNVPRKRSERDAFAQSLFSGKDDAYNTIEGMVEQGEASRLRKLLTDFGSGYRGLGKDERELDELSVADLEEADTAKERFDIFRKALSEYGEEVGTGHKRIVIPKSLISEDQLTDKLGFLGVDVAIPEAGQTQFRSFRHPDMLYHLHEHGEVWTMHLDRHEASTMAVVREEREAKQKGEELGFFDKISTLVGGAAHVATEGAPGLFYYLKGRVTDAPTMLQRWKRDVDEEYIDFLHRFQKSQESGVQRLTNMFTSVKSRAHDIIESLRIPTENRATNGFDGMHHGGISSATRKDNTGFGSKYDRARALAKAMGVTYEQLFKTTKWKKMVTEAQEIKLLGSGVAAHAHLMEGSIRTKWWRRKKERFQFVQKKLRPFEETVQQLAENSAPNPSALQDTSFMSWIREQAPSFRNLTKEQQAMHRLRDTGAVPTPYSLTDDTLTMELMPGAPVADFMEKGTRMGNLPFDELQSTVEIASKRGIVNRDIHGNNILFDKKTGRVSWIDWGAADVGTPGSAMEAQMSQMAMGQKISGLRRNVNQIPESVPAAPAGGFEDFGDLMASAPKATASSKKTAMHLGAAQTGQQFDAFGETGLAPVMRKKFSDSGSGYQGLLGSVSLGVAKVVKASRPEKVLARAADLRKTQEQLWHCAIRGGRYHNVRGRHSFPHHSRFGGMS